MHIYSVYIYLYRKINQLYRILGFIVVPHMIRLNCNRIFIAVDDENIVNAMKSDNYAQKFVDTNLLLCYNLYNYIC